MAITYVNDLRLSEMGTGDNSGTWGTVTNTNLELIGEALGFGTEAITTNADTHASTIADGSTDPVRAMYVKYTGTLDSACTITIGPNTVNKFYYIENATSGSQNIIISQGSGANVTIPAGDVKAVYLDGAGSGAAVVDAFASLSVVDLKVSGNLDVDGTANLDAVDIDGAVQIDNTVSVGVDDTGYDVKFFGDTASAFMLWDASADDLILGGAAGLSVNSAALVTGVLTTTAATVFNGGFASNANSTVGGTLITTGNMSISETGADNEKSLTIANSSVAGGMIGVEGSSGNRFSGSAANNMFMGTTTADGIEFATSNTVRANIAADGSASFNGSLTIPSDIIHAGDTDTVLQFDGADNFRVITGNEERLRCNNTEVVINENGADMDFRVESDDKPYCLFVNSTQDNVSIGYSAESQQTSKGLVVLSGDDTGGVYLVKEDGSQPSSGEGLGSFAWRGIDDTNTMGAADAKISAFAVENHSGSDAATDMRFFTKTTSQGPGNGATEVFRLTQTGDVIAQTGDIYFATAGKGIVLGATTNVDANTLDDYEEGTFTPTQNYQNATNNNAASVNAASGRYTKIGNVVHFTIRMNVEVPSSLASDNYTIQSFPFASENITNVDYVYSSFLNGKSLVTNPIHFMHQPNQTVAFMTDIQGTGNGGPLMGGAGSGTSELNLTGTYRTA